MDIEVFRSKQFQDMARDYKLFADGKEVAFIKRGVKQTISLPNETQFNQAKIDWCSSAKFQLRDSDSNKIFVKNSFASNIVKVFFIFVLYNGR